MTDLCWLWTYLTVIPFLTGIAADLLLLKVKKSYLITTGIVVLSILAWVVVSNINTHGSEGPGLRCLQLSCFALGMTIVEIIRFIHRLKNGL